MIFNLDVVMKNTTVSLNSNYPEDATVIAGEDVTFKAVITDEGNPKEHSLQWYVDGTAIEDATGETYTRSTSSDKGVISVWCEVSNKAGTTTSRHATLTVKKVPMLDASFPADASVVVHNSATFAAVAVETGYPDSYTYQWYVDNVAQSGATGHNFSYTPTSVGTHEVYCAVTNEAGTVNTRTATLTANRLYLYKAGDECRDITGGINYAPMVVGSNGSAYPEDTVTKHSDNIYLKCSNQYQASIATANKVDVSIFSKLCANLSNYGNSTSNGYKYFGLYNAYNAKTGSVAEAFLANGVIELDVSNITGSYYVAIALNSAYGYAAHINVHEIWLE